MTTESMTRKIRRAAVLAGLGLGVQLGGRVPLDAGDLHPVGRDGPPLVLVGGVLFLAAVWRNMKGQGSGVRPPRWSRWLAAVARAVRLAVALGAAFPAVLRIPRRNPGAAAVPPRALFSHRTHGSFGCYACHPSVFPQAPGRLHARRDERGAVLRPLPRRPARRSRSPGPPARGATSMRASSARGLRGAAGRWRRAGARRSSRAARPRRRRSAATSSRSSGSRRSRRRRRRRRRPPAPSRPRDERESRGARRREGEERAPTGRARGARRAVVLARRPPAVRDDLQALPRRRAAPAGASRLLLSGDAAADHRAIAALRRRPRVRRRACCSARSPGATLHGEARPWPAGSAPVRSACWPGSGRGARLDATAGGARARGGRRPRPATPPGPRPRGERPEPRHAVAPATIRPPSRAVARAPPRRARGGSPAPAAAQPATRRRPTFASDRASRC